MEDERGGLQGGGGSETAEIGQSPLEPTPFLDFTVWWVSLGAGDAVAGILRARTILVRDGRGIESVVCFFIG